MQHSGLLQRRATRLLRDRCIEVLHKMSVTQNIKCPSCQALANPLWHECAVCQSPLFKPDWLKAWRELALVTAGLTTNDPRLERVMRWLDVCDTAFSLDSWPAFCEADEQVREIMRGRP